VEFALPLESIELAIDERVVLVAEWRRDRERHRLAGRVEFVGHAESRIEFESRQPRDCEPAIVRPIIGDHLADDAVRQSDSSMPGDSPNATDAFTTSRSMPPAGRSVS